MKTLVVTFQILYQENNPLLLPFHFTVVHFCFFFIFSFLVVSTAFSPILPVIISSASFFPTLCSASFPYFSMISHILSNVPFFTLFTMLIPSSQNPPPYPLMIPPHSSPQRLPGRDPDPLSFFTAAFPTSVCELGGSYGFSTRQGKYRFEKSLSHSAPMQKGAVHYYKAVIKGNFIAARDLTS